MEYDYGRLPNLFFKLLALLIACGVFFLFRHKALDFVSAYVITSRLLMVGFVALLIGITIYYS